MNCHYCDFPIKDGEAFVEVKLPVTIRPELMIPGTSSRVAHLSCALAVTRNVPAIPDKTGKWCSYNHPPTGRWCMLAPHGDDVKHELEPSKS